MLLLSVLWQLKCVFRLKKQAGTYCCNYWFCGDIYIWIKKSVLSHWFLCFDKNIIQITKRKSSSGVAIKLFFVSFVLIVLFFFKEILSFVGGMLDFFGLGSRTLYYLINADTVDITTGRDEIHDELWDIVLNDPFFRFGCCW